jgi:hypothetical protein
MKLTSSHTLTNVTVENFAGVSIETLTEILAPHGVKYSAGKAGITMYKDLCLEWSTGRFKWVYTPTSLRLQVTINKRGL